MSSDKKSPSKPGPDGSPRAAASLDLPKSAVTDMTPPAQAADAGAPADAAKTDLPLAADAGKASTPAIETIDVAADQQTAAPDRRDAPEQPEAITAPPPPRRSSGAPVFLGALAGGLFGLAGAYGFATFKPPAPVPSDPRIAGLETLVSGFDKKIATDAEKLSVALKAVEARATALEQKAGALPSGLDDRLKGLDGALKAAQEQAGLLAGKLDLMEKAGGQTAGEAPRVDLAPIASRIIKLEQSLGEITAKLVGNNEAVQSAANAADTRFKAVEQGIAALKAPKPADSSAAILAIAGMAQRALGAGEPVGSMAKALAALGASEDTVKALADLGDRPAAKPAVLADQLADLVARLPKPAAAEPPKAASLTDQVKARLMALVEVRPTGAARAADAAGIAAQARPKLLAGDIEGALALVRTLPAEQVAALKPFLDAASARIAAQRAIQKLEAEALQSAARKS